MKLRPRPWPRRLLLPVVVAVAAGVLASCGGGGDPPAVSVLVVGDSVMSQSRSAMVDFAPADAAVTVAEAPGTAPCDWEHGFADPYGGGRKSYGRELAKAAPQYVILMFTGNPGLSGAAAGCVDASRPYTLAELLESYRGPLTEMAEQASAAQASVYFERPPSRNPAVPPGYDAATHSDRGFQGVPAVASLLESVARSAPAGDRWFYEDGGAAAVDGPGFTYRGWTSCSQLDRSRCIDGLVQVRAGDHDAVHLDQSGCGAILFALGIFRQLPIAGPAPGRLLLDRRSYSGCG